MGGDPRAGAVGVVSSAQPPVLALRSAGVEDLEAIGEVEGASFTDPWSRASFTSLIGESHVYFPVVVVEGQLVAFAIALFAADEAELLNIAVLPASRGHGTGSRLLDAVITEAVRRGAATAWLEVRESNEAARRLYASRGFSVAGRRRRYYVDPVEDALVLRRTGFG